MSVFVPNRAAAVSRAVVCQRGALPRWPVALGLAALAALLLHAACGCGKAQPAAGGPPRKQAATGEWVGQPRDIVRAHRGQILVLLLGREDCPGTAKAMRVLDEYASRRPAELAFVRVEVPLPGEELKAPAVWQHAFPYALDQGRVLAGQYDFFYYPTLLLFDRDGALRFTGGCDAQRLAEMAAEIAGEKPGAAKRNYSLTQPQPGTVAPAFSGRDLEDREVALSRLRGERATVLFFAATSCPFTVKELPQLAVLATEWRKHQVAVVIVNRGEEKAKITPVYSQAAPGVPVVWDQGGEICGAYGVDAVPFFFLLDREGRIVKRRSYTAAAAAGALNTHLGLAAETSRYKPAAAG